MLSQYILTDVNTCYACATMPIIPATQEAEAEDRKFYASPSKVSEILSQKTIFKAKEPQVWLRL
jgi:hypothetical protein